ncbi:hypothetical protein L873DRAFT_572916, partial [Choiromyces venosus 120613-1]
MITTLLSNILLCINGGNQVSEKYYLLSPLMWRIICTYQMTVKRNKNIRSIPDCSEYFYY